MMDNIKDEIEKINGVASCIITIGQDPFDNRMWIKVQGGDVHEIATAIMMHKPAFIQTVGSTSVEVEIHGLKYNVNFTHIEAGI